MRTLNALATIGVMTICYVTIKVTMAVCNCVFETDKGKRS